MNDLVSQFLSEYGDDGTLTEIVEKIPSLNLGKVVAGVCIHKIAQEVHSVIDHHVSL